MKGYKNISGEKGKEAFQIKDICFYETELTAEEEKAVADGNLHNEYYVLYEWEWECHADNDGGIDSFQFGEKEIALSPEDSILYEGKVIGFFTHRRIFLIEGNKTAAGSGGSETVGGWGSISSDSSYTLMKRK